MRWTCPHAEESKAHKNGLSLPHRQEIEDVKAANERRLAEMSARLEALHRKQEELATLGDNRTQIQTLVRSHLP